MITTLDKVDLPSASPERARAFYTAVFGLAPAQDDAPLDLYGAGILSFGSPPARTGACRALVVANYLVPQPLDVTGILDAASAAGAEALKPGKKGFFGGFSGSFRSPDGSIWKVASAHKKDTGSPSSPTRPTEIVIILGVTDMAASGTFYESHGFTADRDYGTKFVDFTFTSPSFRLGLMPLKALAKDVGVDPGDGQRGSPIALVSNSLQHGDRSTIEDPDSVV